MYWEIFSGATAVCAALYAYVRQSQQAPSTSTDTTADTTPIKSSAFIKFQSIWLVVYLLAMFSDWLQGPYAYALYASYGFSEAQIAWLSITGFASSMIFGTFVGSVTDRIGRKKMSIVFAILYGVSALTKFSPSFFILFLGRILSGIATSLLFSVFEAWMICEHKKQGFPDELISDTFAKATAGNGLVAVGAALFSSQLADAYGYSAPFLFAAVPLTLLGLIVFVLWDENYGTTVAPSNETTKEKTKEKSPSSDGNAKDGDKFTSLVSNALTLFQQQPHIALLGFAQSSFEGAMYSFVFLWSSTLSQLNTREETLPYGLIFASFMVSVMCGSYIFTILSAKLGATVVPTIIHTVAMLSMIIAAYTSSEFIAVIAFLFFEVCCGMFWPAYGTLRSIHIPESQRATVSTLFRVPLNMFVISLLLQSAYLSNFTKFMVCASAHLVGLALYTIFAKSALKASSASKQKTQ